MPPKDFDNTPGFREYSRTPTQVVLPLNPYISDVKLTICDNPVEQEQSRLLIADLMTNEVAAARVESFTIECLCDFDDDKECRCGGLLYLFTELIGRGESHLKALKRIKWVPCCVVRSPKF